MGQIGCILPEVPLFLGETARDVALTLYHRLARHDAADCAPILAALERAKTFHPGVPLTLGDLRITPLLVDHSAFDAYMFLIEGDGLEYSTPVTSEITVPEGNLCIPSCAAMWARWTG